jgi:cell division protein FtsB
MRHSKAIIATGRVRKGTLGVRHAVVVAVTSVAVIWGGVAFAQEAYVVHKLNQQAADLRHQNAELAAQNRGYKKDVQAISSGAANEEQARINGYARPNERLYLVTPPNPAPSPSPSASPSPSPRGP